MKLPPPCPALILAAVALALGGASGCTPDTPPGPTESSPPIASTAFAADSIPIHDLPALILDIPEEALSPPDTGRLREELRQAEGLAFIGLKAGNARRTHMELTASPAFTVSPSHLPRGRRAAMPAEVLRDALAAIANRGAATVKYYRALGMALVRLPVDSAIALLDHPNVDFLTPVRPGPRPGFAAGPTGPLPSGGTQVTPWNIDSVGAPLAWPYSRGSGTRLLIIDSGHDWTHPDLGVVPWSNCNRGPYTGCSDDYPEYHGTAVAGVAIARDNLEGVVGLAPGTQPGDMYYWGACVGRTACYYPEIIAALDWAAESLGARGVVNMSYGGEAAYYPEQVAVASASNAGHVLVSIAGNSGPTGTPMYPAAYSNVIGVGGINQNKVRNPASTTGNHVDLVAPWDAYTTKPSNQYSWESGMSIAAPHVAGLALLLRARYPGWTAWDVFYRMRQTAEDLGPAGWDSEYGWGKIRAHIAVTLDAPTVTASVVNGKPRLTWIAIPLATGYRIYRRVTPTLAPDWELWAQVTGTAYTDSQTPVTSIYGYGSIPGASTAVGYYVVAVSGGVESAYGTYATYIPNGIPPY
jgi:hypothetical protein